MDRKAIKAKAKELIKGNIWNLLWPLLLINVVSGVISGIGGPAYSIDPETFEITNNTSVLGSLFSTISVLFTAIATVGYVQYLLNFVRGKEYDFNTMLETCKKKWVVIIITTLVGGLLIGLGYVLLVVPGIILTLMFAMTDYVICDKELSGVEPLTESKKLMDGHKGEYFVFNLSFLGWYILSLFTFGILLIWVIPYYNVAEALYYEELKKLNK